MKNWFQGSDIRERHYDIGASLVLGNQWGDEGKGKITDRLTQESDVIIRFQGGHNAGHTVKVGDKEFDLHILPSGTVTPGKINIITSGCVLGISLGKIDIEKIQITPNGVNCTETLDTLLKKNNGQNTEVGLIPELEKLQKGGVNIRESGLKISGETTVIGMHNVLLDGFDERCRVASGLKPIGSTGSGISRAYASEAQRYHFSLNDLLLHPDTFYDSIKALWISYAHIFPNISVDHLIAWAKKERAAIMEYIRAGDIEIIENESQYIKTLHKEGKKIVGEGAQSSMIGAGNSIFGTASSPSLQTFMNTTGLTVKKIGNIFLVHKLPPSSVGTRPDYLKYPDSQALSDFREKYAEFGVSTGRPRDLFRYSLPETAKGAWLNVRGIDDETKIVPVYNRIDGVADALTLDEGVMRVVLGFSYDAEQVYGEKRRVEVGVHSDTTLEPRTLLRDYPEKSAQGALFGLTESDLRMVEVSGVSIQEKIETLLGLHNAAIFRKNAEREFLVGTGPKRDDIELRRGSPIRRI